MRNTLRRGSRNDHLERGRQRLVPVLGILLALAIASERQISAQGTAFLYQGRLSDSGGAANGLYDLTFGLFPFNSGAGQIGPTVATNALAVSNGIFATTIDFGPGMFTGADRWLEISVRTNGGGTLSVLTPRQQITAAPYAITASNLSGALPAAQLSGTLSSSQLGGTYSGALTFSNAANSFAGSGTGLSSLNASNLTSGTVHDGRLSSNVALLDRTPQTFAGSNVFNGRIGIGATNLGGSLTLRGPTGPPPSGFDSADNGLVLGSYATNDFKWIQSYGGPLALNPVANGLAVGKTNPIAGFLLDVNGSVRAGATLGTNSFNTSPNKIVIENPGTGGRATFLALAGPGAAVSTNRVEFQLEADEGQRRGILGMSSNHELEMRINNNQILTLSTNMNVGIGISTPNTRLQVNGMVTATGFSGPAAGLTGLTASNLTGTVPLAQLPVAVVTNNNTSSVNLTGSFTGSGAGLTGVQGALPWVTVSGTSVQAQPNTGYVATDPAQVTVNLLANGNVGDVVRVFGLGAGGWRLQPCAAAWLPHESNRQWSSVASSADGTKCVAVANGGQIYTSSDSGVTWTPRESARSWFAIASSSDAGKLVAIANQGQIYTSIDSGTNWVARETNRNWISVASSSDGAKLVALDFNTGVYTSTDSGTNWTKRDNRAWWSVASSSDGTKLVAVDHFGPSATGGQIYTSTDSGLFWTARESNRFWQAVASSVDGAKLVAVVAAPSNPGQIYTSTDSGVSWTPRESNRFWIAVASSSDGVTLAAVVGGASTPGQIYTSTDSGVTWCVQENNRNWFSVALSADGSRRFAVVNAGQIYTSVASPLVGLQGSMVDLQYTGNGTWQPLSLAAVNGNFTIGGSPIIASTTAAPVNGSTLTPASGFVRISPASVVTLNATTAISAGSAAGQMLILEGTSDINTVTINDNANTRLVSNRTLGANDSLTLMWDGAAWVELAFANN